MDSALTKHTTLSSGFTIEVTPLAPYHMDFINDLIPEVQLPKRKIQLASGDEIELDYEAPDTSPAADDPDFELYMRYRAAIAESARVAQRKERVRRDFLLSTCVSIVDGPIDIDDEQWVVDTEAAFGQQGLVPSEAGQRRLWFIKAVVLKVPTLEQQAVLQSAMYTEVTMQGITAALQGFRTEVGRKKPGRHHRRGK